MEKKKAVAYWNIYDSETGLMIEKEKPITHNAMPSTGGLIIGIPGKVMSDVNSGHQTFHAASNPV